MKKFLNAMRNAQRVYEQRKRAIFHPQRNMNTEDGVRSLVVGCETKPCGDQTQQKNSKRFERRLNTAKSQFELPSVSSQATDQGQPRKELSDLAQLQRESRQQR
jgi:hypothetical protein